jgi:hypothetical protein
MIKWLSKFYKHIKIWTELLYNNLKEHKIKSMSKYSSILLLQIMYQMSY